MFKWRRSVWISVGVISLLAVATAFTVLSFRYDGAEGQKVTLNRDKIAPTDTGTTFPNADGAFGDVNAKPPPDAYPAKGSGQVSTRLDERGKTLKALPVGKIVLIAPGEMTVQETRTVSARVGVKISDEVLMGTVTHDDQTSLKTLHVSTEMEAQLEGSSFRIVPISERIQPIAEGDFPTVWKWQVTALNEGDQILEATLYALIPDGDSTARLRIDSYFGEVSVKVKPASWGEVFIKTLIPLLASLIVIGGIVIFVARVRRRKAPLLSQGGAASFVKRSQTVSDPIPIDYTTVNWDDISGKQQKVLRESIVRTFPKAADFDLFLANELNKGPIGLKVSDGGFEQQVHDYLLYVQAEGWTLDLVRALQEKRFPSTRHLVEQIRATASIDAQLN
ncbi:effector-associated domain EAD1-containing protein [Phyllobacterium sp. UNC302MFCol5.2]|uniref:effector-associated domain EAD1-containing protein n=1 Tax=Phyllobacterium sp. UNC302MFCol5.2 TaxID=1449065 RepID=UPI00048A27F7|nr:effector-associated domain EAD1-containing protein [Phyllobacterium sp. UNC302MFCol5.2]